MCKRGAVAKEIRQDLRCSSLFKILEVCLFDHIAAKRLAVFKVRADAAAV